MIAFLGVLFIMGIVIDIITQKRKFVQRTKKLEAKITELESSIEKISKEAKDLIKLSEEKITDAQRNHINTEYISQLITEECDLIIHSYETIEKKLNILSDVMDNKNITDEEKKHKLNEYIQSVKDDILSCKKQKEIMEQNSDEDILTQSLEQRYGKY